MAMALAGSGKKFLEAERARLAKLLREGEMLCNRPWVRYVPEIEAVDCRQMLCIRPWV